MYFVGRSGSIAHYNGSEWRKIESGTELPIQDIFGSNSKNGNKIYYVAAELFSGKKSELHKIKNGETNLINNKDLGTSTLSVWSNNHKLYMAGYKLLLSYNDGENFIDISNGVKNRGLYSIRGLNYNDIFIVGEDFQVVHFNGNSWKKYNLNNNASGQFFKVMQQKNTVCVVGVNNSNRSAILMIGRR